LDSAGICIFHTRGMALDTIPDVALSLLEVATGAGYNKETMFLASERIWNLERLFNLRAGLTAKDDTLPRRQLEEPMPEGPAKGHVVELDRMLPEYYELRGWDKNGVPTPGKLAELGLEQADVGVRSGG